ncbi:MAG: hypothetical protein B7X02_02995, partial [Rhodospirillales bacterium 12-54-5]
MKTALHPILFSFTLAFALTAGVSAQAQALNYQNYNVIVFNDLSTDSNIFGRTFIGNNLLGGNSGDYGNQLPSTISASDRTLVVGGDILSSSSGIQVQRGSVYVDGSVNRAINFNGTDSSGNHGTIVADHSIDSATSSIRGYSIAQSEALRALMADSTVSFPTSSSQPGNIVFTATPGSDGLAVFNVNAADIFSNSKAQSILLNAPANTNIVINVGGTSIDFNQGNFGGDFLTDYAQAHVLWNFYEATSISINRNFNGGILAPYASITNTSSIDGIVVANNLYAHAQVHTPVAY